MIFIVHFFLFFEHFSLFPSSHLFFVCFATFSHYIFFYIFIIFQDYNETPLKRGIYLSFLHLKALYNNFFLDNGSPNFFVEDIASHSRQYSCLIPPTIFDFRSKIFIIFLTIIDNMIRTRIRSRMSENLSIKKRRLSKQFSLFS